MKDCYLMSNKFVAIDVETANENVSSICPIGLAVFEHGEIVKEWVTLVNPEEDFSAMNVGIHGIKESDVKNKPKFIEIYDELYGYINECICVSHSHFDRVSINRSIEKYSLNKPAVTWLDSARVARRTWTQLASKGYGLYNVCEIIGYKFKHHDALEDAKACGVILHEALKISGKSIAEWLERVELPINSSQKLHYISGGGEGILSGEVIVFTGSLSMSRSDAALMASKMGCDVATSVTKKTTLLVVGDQDLSKFGGKDKSSKHIKAEELIAQGQNIRIVGESDFIRIISDHDNP